MQLVQFQKLNLPGAQAALVNLRDALIFSLILFLPVAPAGDRESGPHFVPLKIAKSGRSNLIAAMPPTVEAAINAALKTGDDLAMPNSR